MEELKLNYGKINTLESCPLKYKLRYVRQVPVPVKESPHLSFYGALHDTLEIFHKEALDREELKETYERKWISKGFKNAAEEEEWKRTGWSCLEKFYDRFLQEKPVVKYLGQFIRLEIPPEIRLSGRLDRIDLLPDGSYEIVQYKTGKSAKTGSELANDLQAAILYMGGDQHKLFKDKISRISFYYLRSGEKVSATFGKEEIHGAKKRIQEAAANIRRFEKGGVAAKAGDAVSGVLGRLLPALKRDRLDPTDDEGLADKGPLCSACEYLAACPAWPVKPMDLAEEPEALFKKRVRLSYSKLNAYKNCPRAWKKSYLDRFPMEPRPFFDFGNAIHETFETFFDPRGAKKSDLKHLLRLWEECFAKYQTGYKNKEEKKRYHEKGRGMVETFYKKFVEGPGYRPAHAVELYFEIPMGSEALMTGFIDRIDKVGPDEYEILDYKTEPTDRPQEKVDHDDQLTIYHWACEKVMGLKIKQLGLFMLSFDKKITTSRKAEDIPAVEASIDSVAAEIKENQKKYQLLAPLADDIRETLLQTEGGATTGPEAAVKIRATLAKIRRVETLYLIDEIREYASILDAVLPRVPENEALRESVERTAERIETDALSDGERAALAGELRGFTKDLKTLDAVQKVIAEPKAAKTVDRVCRKLLDLAERLESPAQAGPKVDAFSERMQAKLPLIEKGEPAAAASLMEELKGLREESPYFPPKKNKYCRNCDYLNDNPARGTVACGLKAEIMGDATIRTMEYEEDEYE